MTLSDLFSKTDMTEDRLAKLVGVNQSTINRLRNADRKASLGLAFRIEKATGGVVRASDLPLSKQAKRDLRLIHQSPKDREAAA